MNSARGFYKFLIFLIFIFVFLSFLPQKRVVLAACRQYAPKRCGSWWWGYGCLENRKYSCDGSDQFWCDRYEGYCVTSYLCDCDGGDCCGGDGVDLEPPACQNVIPRTPTGGFSFLSLNNPGFEQGSAYWNIFNGSIYSDGWSLPAYYCGLGYCAARPPHSGSKALHLGLDGGEGTAVYQMGVTPNHVYRVSVWGMGSSRSYGEPDDKCWADVSAYLTTESGGVTKTTRVADPVKQPSWVQGSVTIWARSNTLTLTLQAKGSHCSHNSAGAVFDDLTVEELPTSACSSQNCLLEVYATDNKSVAEMRFSNDKVNWSAYEEYNSVKMSYTLGSNGQVWAQFKDGAGNESEISDTCSGTCNIPPPTGTITGTVKKNEINQNCNVGNAEARQVTISRTSDPIYNCFLTSTGGSYNTDSCPTKPLQGYVYNVSVSYDGAKESCLSCPTITCSQPVSLVSSPATANFTVFPFKPTWFQTQEGDVHAQGNISVSVPAGENFSLDGSGGTPGVVSRSGSADFSPGGVSSTGWLAKTSFSRKKYEYFRQLLGISPDDEDSFDSFGDIGDEIIYYSSDGVNIDPGAGNFPAGKKAVILVNGNVNINDNISVPNDSFLAFIASGNIEVADSVSQINGIYITDSKFEAGTNETTTLECYGTFVANSFEMDGRDLGALNESTPGVKFIYRPDLWLNAPAELLVPSYTWQELAP